MTKQADSRRDARTSPAGMRSALPTEADDVTPDASPVASAGGEMHRCGTEAPHPPTPATDLYASLGWRVLTKSNNVLLACGRGVDIVTVSSELASEVHNSLRMLGLDVAVLEVRGESVRWAFFCQTPPLSLTSLGEFSLRGVNHYGTSALFLLPPSPESNSESLRWIRSPAVGVTVLASIYAITACAQTALQAQ